MPKQRAYGNTGLKISSLAYGAMSIAADQDISGGVAPSLLHALENGITLIDTARVYPHSEEIVAKTLRQWRGARPVLSTKLAPGSRETFRFHRPLREAYTAETICASVEASLRALETDFLDIVHLHQWHYLWTHETEWLETLQALKRAGKIGHVAVSAQDHEHDALLEAMSRGMVDGVQLIVNVFESRPVSSVLPLAAMHGIGVIARCAFDSGGLAGTLSAEDFAARNFLKYAPYEEYCRRLEELRAAFVPHHARDMASLALRFVLSLPGISSVAVGMPSASFVKSSLRACEDGPLPPDVVEAIRRHHVWTKNFYERLV